MTARPIPTDQALTLSTADLLAETRARAIETYGETSIHVAPFPGRAVRIALGESNEASDEWPRNRTPDREERAATRVEAAQAAAAWLRVVDLLREPPKTCDACRQPIEGGSITGPGGMTTHQRCPEEA